MKRIALVLALASLALPLSAAAGENLMANGGGFEAPAIEDRVEAGKGGDPSKVADTIWEETVTSDEDAPSGLSIGLTNQIAHTGKQSLFVDFNKVTAQAASVGIISKQIAVTAGKKYRLSMWARIDGKRPLSIDERRPIAWSGVQFFQNDGTTEVGKPAVGVQLIPGVLKPGGGTDLMFRSDEWREMVMEFTVPEGAAFAQITWSWSTPNEAGETDGVIYWDDAALSEIDAASAPAATPAPSPSLVPVK